MTIDVEGQIVDRLIIIHGLNREKAKLVFKNYVHLISGDLQVGTFNAKDHTWTIWDAYQEDQKEKEANKT